MAKFAQGTKVVHIDTREHGIIQEVGPAGRGGKQLYHVVWSGHESDEFEVRLLPDCDITDAFERCKQKVFDSYIEFSKRNTTFKIQKSNNSTVSSLKASRTLFRAYQFKPLLKFLNSPDRRLLIADEVGLGKTIEAGHIMLELKARNELREALIVCPKSLQIKWKDELDAKFGLSFTIYEDKETLLNDLFEKRGHFFGIVNYEKIRVKRKKVTKDTEKAEEKDLEQKEPECLIDYVLKNEKSFSLVLCDEAHRLRNSDTLAYKGAEILTSSAKAVVFLTATPVMISTENLYNLMHLLDNAKYYDPQIFDNILAENKPFVDAITALNHNRPLTEIARNLESATITTTYTVNERVRSKITTVAERFANYLLYQRLIGYLNSEEDSDELRAKIQYDLSSMSLINGVFSRTRKREVTKEEKDKVERKPHLCQVELYDEERAYFDEVIDEYIDENTIDYDDFGEPILKKGAILGLIQKKKQVSSSVFGYKNKKENLSKPSPQDEYEEYPDAKVEKVVEIAHEAFANNRNKIIVFSEFHNTLKYLKLRLEKLGYGCIMIYGGTPMKERGTAIKKFQNDDNLHFLLSSEVGSEGLDMQFCDTMINYDLPWNPMVVEQRIGRIDRFGQKSSIVNIYNLIVEDSIQEEIYTRLLDRIGIFHGTIGDMEAILDAKVEIEGREGKTIGEMINDMERELYCTKLTEEERKRITDEVSRAIENEKLELQKLEEGLTNTLTNDSYFKDEINKILRNNSYLTEFELKNFVQMALRENKTLSACEFKEYEKGVFKLTLPKSAPFVLQNFLTANQPASDECDKSFYKFKNDIRDVASFMVTFNQEKAFEDKTLMYLNMYHPLVLACKESFSRMEKVVKNTFCYALESDSVLEKNKIFLLAVYQINMSRMVHGVKKVVGSLVPMIYDLSSNCIVKDEILTEHVFSCSQTKGIQKAVSIEGLTPTLVDEIHLEFHEILDGEKEKLKEDIVLQDSTDRQRNSEQLEQMYFTRKKSLESSLANYTDLLEMLECGNDKKAISDAKGAINLMKGNLKRLEQDYESRLLFINEDPQIKVEHEMVCLNYIKIL